MEVWDYQFLLLFFVDLLFENETFDSMLSSELICEN